MTTPVTDHWHELVTVALLGTDRRDPPPAPPGPLADLVDDALRDRPSSRMLVHVAATTAARRAGLRPAAPAAPLAPPRSDDRPVIPPAAARRWWEIAGDWPVLEDEWLLTVQRAGWRPSPDVLVALLRRHRGDAGRAARVAAVGGPLVGWLTEHLPELAPTARRRENDADAERDAIDDLPGLAVPPELLNLLPAAPSRVVPAVVHGFTSGTYAVAHGTVLMNFIARCRHDALAPLAEGLRSLDPAAPTTGLAHSLAELADTRRAMLDELAPDHPPATRRPGKDPR
jgi:hypothetical protein